MFNWLTDGLTDVIYLNETVLFYDDCKYIPLLLTAQDTLSYYSI